MITTHIYIYIYIYVCIYLYIYMCVFVCIYDIINTWYNKWYIYDNNKNAWFICLRPFNKETPLYDGLRSKQKKF